MHNVALELAVQDPAGARIASDVGARRVELCSALGATGGITPSAALIEAAIDAAAVVPETAGAPILEVHVLVRPRPGGFTWSAEERALMVRETVLSVDAGADGVVVGALTPEGAVDEDTIRALVAAAGDAEVTFHRALDVVPDQLTALAVLADLGVTRVLTSGAAARAVDGVDRLALLAERSADLGVEIMAGGGVRLEDVPALAAAGVDAIHLSAKRAVAEDGGPGGGTGGYEVTDDAIAHAVAKAVRELQLR
ncbi:copper homeostasis protein CutC [Myceligenerans pegani]|uniref:PF03932 family protein CutC n=1 Tax=Myceligenerans pegani TaxID=2776917 RepID=A0ABR9MWY3_9MICO|nr:copper homeostasis protein CutC [Myceligenerans sp. TRM 65318]MBE1875899.1 copper homeostasis protein CutC [Myceligenerans sp. TRM 65318]MBE3018170.1 copper homeostasis protein CutC [Myceligenerans sp. TRM 65318]